jgi:hypothetical protein
MTAPFRVRQAGARISPDISSVERACPDKDLFIAVAQRLTAG